VLDTIRRHCRLRGYLEAGAPKDYLLIRSQSSPRNFVQRCEALGFKVAILHGWVERRRMHGARHDNPFTVQSDHTALVEVESPRYAAGRDALARFAELVKSPEHVHTYRITPLSVWNACAAGVEPDWIRAQMRDFSKYDVPRHRHGNGCAHDSHCEWAGGVSGDFGAPQRRRRCASSPPKAGSAPGTSN
jgi:hypothetical protein